MKKTCSTIGLVGFLLVGFFGCNKDPQEEFNTKARAAIQQANNLAAQLKYDQALEVIEPIFLESSDLGISSVSQEILICIQNVDSGKKDYDKKIKQGYKQEGTNLFSPKEIRQRAEAIRKRKIEREKQQEIRRQQRKQEKEAKARADSEAKEAERERIKKITVSSETMAYNYDLNEINADAHWKNRMCYVVGPIEDIGKDILNTPYITMKGYSYRSVQFMFDKKDEAQLMKLRPGQTVTVKGVCQGLLMNVLLKDCVIQ